MLWWFDQQCPDSTAMQVVSIQTLHHPMGCAGLRLALAAVVNAHPVLRGHMHLPEGALVPVWHTVPAAMFALPFEELPPMPSEQAVAALTRLAWGPFDLLQGPLIRAAAVPDAQIPGRMLFMLSLHHSVADGESILHVLRALADHLAGRPLRPARPFCEWVLSEQQRWQPGSPDRERALAHWRQRLTGVPARKAWPWSPPHGAQGDAQPRTRSLPWRLDDTRWQALRQLARHAGASDFCLVATLAAWSMYRVHMQPDVVLAYPVSQRRQRAWARSVGHLVNLALLRLDFAPHQSFMDVLRQAQQRLNEDLPFADLPMEALIEALQPMREPGRIPWASLLLAPNRRTREAGILPDSHAWPLPPLDTQEHLQWVWSADAGHCAGSLNYATAHVPAPLAQGLLDHWLDAAHRLPETAHQPLGDWFRDHRLTSQERARLATWNATTRPLPAPDTSLAHAFAAQAARTPQAIALQMAGHAWCYADLAARVETLAAHVAHAMQRHRMPPGHPVGLLIARSGHAIVALLAIVRAGGAYLPLSPDDPPERLQRLVQLGGVSLVLSLRAHGAAQALEDQSLEVLHLDALPSPTPPACPPPSPVSSAQAAYVLFTSGSTGTPKAVAVGHRQVLRLVHGLTPVHLGPEERMLHAAPLGFDASTFEIWGALLHGATLVIAPASPIDPATLAHCIAHERITTLWLTAALFEQFTRQHLASLVGVRQLLAGGDVLPPASVRRVQQAHPHVRLFNGYGPTETTTFATLHPITLADTAGGQPLPIGRPIGNTTLHVLDEALRPVPPGHVGEICIAGEGVALGYVGDAALNAERFIPDPASPGARMYRSGDLGAWRTDGVLEFFGRRDAQVKIRGHRVELAEIEATLQSLDGVLNAAMLVQATAQGPQLVACVRPYPGRTLQPHRLASEAAQRLPGYMLPRRWVSVPDWPLDANGKLHRRALLHGVEASTAPTHTMAWASETAAALCAQLQQLWAEMLELPSCSADDHFMELGGSSLGVARLCAALQPYVQRPVPMAEVYRHPTPADLTRWLLTSAAPPTEQLRSPLVCLQAGQSPHAPLVLIHGIDGGSQIFTHLVKQFPSSRPVYALQGPQPVSPEQLAQLFPSLDAMATFYAQAIQRESRLHAAAGVVLGGFSAGVALLLPLRDALRQRGQRVSGLVVLDAPAPNRATPREELETWMQPRHGEGNPTSSVRHALDFRRVFAHCLMQPPRHPAADETPLLAVLVGRRAEEKRADWHRWWPAPALRWQLLPQRQHHNFLLPPSDIEVAKTVEQWWPKA